MPNRFVNPYTFVPLPSAITRQQPPGHDRLADEHYSGTLQVSMMARTPLLVRGFGATPDSDGTMRDRLPRRCGQVFIPGSSLHGAFRSLHETIAGGCLRVVDLDYLPVHREVPTAATTRGLRLAVVSQVDEGTGRPTELRLASEEAWFERNQLVAGLGANMATSQFFTHHGGTSRTARGRTVYSDGTVAAATAATPQRWLLLVTDTRARSGQHPSYFAAGRSFSQSVSLTEDAWLDYVDCVGDADDMHRYRPGDVVGKGQRWADVGWPPPTSPVPEQGTVFGRRRTARAWFDRGQPVWVRLQDGEVSEIKLSVVWRHLGRGTVRERIPPHLRPCDNPKDLCASCRVFGSADIQGREDDAAAVQSSYRGHVRFGDALPSAAMEAQRWHLAPLGAPKLSAGQFYLDPSGVADAKKIGESGHQPRSTWGSTADQDGAGRARFRPMRGRKFYWRTSDPTVGTHPRGEARSHQSDELKKHVELIPAGTHFGFEVSFENLDLAGLGGLLAALQPGRVLADGNAGNSEIVASVGGGKPFGFGAATTHVQVTSAQNAKSRYLGATSRSVSIDEAVLAFRGAVAHQARQGWPSLRRLLTLDAVNNSDVWYPIGTGQRGTESYDEAFDFWQASSGRESHGVRTRLAGPPLPTAADQRMHHQ